VIIDHPPSAHLCKHLKRPQIMGNLQFKQGEYSTFVDGKDGFVYGIPYNARRVVRINPLDKSWKMIGPDLGGDKCKWWCGVRANNGCIYCTPFFGLHILKIDTIRGTVKILSDVEMPEEGGGALWASGALASDNSIYYMPNTARRIMRLNPDNDSLSSVGDDLGEGYKYRGTVIGSDDHVYGMPYHATHIVKYNPADPDTTSTVGEEVEGRFYCGNGVLCGDGFIYAANGGGQVLKVNTTHNSYTLIGGRIYSGDGEHGWGDAIIGDDECIYWPPSCANRVLKFDPKTQQLPSLVGGDLGRKRYKWEAGALSSNGVIHCFPTFSSRVLVIDPFQEFSTTLQTNMKLYPDELGRLFLKDEECDETFFESSLRKFGGDKVFTLIEECLPLDAEWNGAHTTNGGNLLPFMVAASCENCAASVIYSLLRRNVNGFLGNISGNSN
jgi:hypothetical protein